MVAAKNNGKRKNNANGPKRFNKQMNNQRRPPFGANQFQQFQQNPIPNPGYQDFNEPAAPPQMQNPRPIGNMGRKNPQNKKIPPGKRQNFNMTLRSMPGPNFVPRRAMPPPFMPPMNAPIPPPRPFPGEFRPFFPPAPMRRPVPPFIPPMGPMPRPNALMVMPPMRPRRRPGAISKPGPGGNPNKNKKAKNAPTRKKGNNKHQPPQYPLDKPWVTEEMKEVHAKKTDLENRLKGVRNDELFAEFKKQRDIFVKLYDEAKLEYIGKNKKEVN